MNYYGGDKACEYVFQNDVIREMVANGWKVGHPDRYDRKLALYSEDLLSFIKSTQSTEWEKYERLYPNNAEKKMLERVATQLEKADPNAADKQMRTYGTLGVLRHKVKDRGARFKLCQFKPDHDLNPDTLASYKENILRVVPEVVYSPYSTEEHFKASGTKSRKWRIDLVLFLNGIPIVTMELKSEFKQSVENALKQYKETRFPIDQETKKPEPLLTFKRGALVHFAVSQYEVYMATKLNGEDTYFLPFNKGTADGGKGNDIPEDINRYASDYLWNEVLLPENILKIIGRFIHLEITREEDYDGREYAKETLIFPRYHQWDVVNRLISAAREEGPGQKYLVQHSAGSGKSNSIAWTAHQLTSIYNKEGKKVFDSVIIVTDRTVLDDQLQDTIYQLEHTDGVVGRINRKEGQGSKSEKLAKALEESQPIIIVTIQTFPHVIKAIADSTSLKGRHYAIIADEAHSSQTGSTARQLKEVLMIDTKDQDVELSSEDIISAAIASRKTTDNLSYFAFTATPKSKTIELFGRLPNPQEAPSDTNKPKAFHVYSMRQAIEEGFILDVLKNYTNYKVAYNLSMKAEAADKEVESSKARTKVSKWVRLHDHNISQKVVVIVEHYKDNVMHLLNGQAKAMVVTGSRKEAVRYKLAFDKYIKEQGYQSIHSMVAFSGEVTFDNNDPEAEGLIDEKFTEVSMNPNLKGRDMRTAFDSDDYQVMLVANKFQTGFDQPKLCAMYVDKKLGGLECVQTLSRLNRIYPGKAVSGTFVIDFFNEPEEILKAFQEYYQTATLIDVSDPNIIYDIFEKLNNARIYEWREVEQFVEAYLNKNKKPAVISNICKPAVERWQKRYTMAVSSYNESKDIFERSQASEDAVLIGNAENSLKESKKEKDGLEIFKKELTSYVHFYEFISQIVDFDDAELEKLCLFARNLGPMLRVSAADEEIIDLSSLELSHYRLSKIRQQNLNLIENAEDVGLSPGDGLGTSVPRDRKEEYLSKIIGRLNELFDTEGLSDKDMVNFAHTIRDKVKENQKVMNQIANNTPEQALLGDYSKAVDEAIMDSGDVFQSLMMQVLSDSNRAQKFSRLVFDMLLDDYKKAS